VKLVVELGIPELTTEQIETLSSTAENAARKYVLSKVSSKMIDRLDISVEAAGSKPVSVTVEVDLELTAKTEGIDAEALVKEATNEAHKAIEKYLRKIK
jgi:DNA-binding protein YbaB